MPAWTRDPSPPPRPSRRRGRLEMSAWSGIHRRCLGPHGGAGDWQRPSCSWTVTASAAYPAARVFGKCRPGRGILRLRRSPPGGAGVWEMSAWSGIHRRLRVLPGDIGSGKSRFGRGTRRRRGVPPGGIGVWKMSAWSWDHRRRRGPPGDFPIRCPRRESVVEGCLGGEGDSG